MAAKARYILDADVFITAKNRYYAFDICPGFWASVIYHHRAGRTYSIDRVRNELLVGRKTEDLVQWVTNDLPKTFFLGVDDEPVTTAYTDVMLWAQRSPRYFDHAKAKFATGADGWLVATQESTVQSSSRTGSGAPRPSERSSFRTCAPSSTCPIRTRSGCSRISPFGSSSGSRADAGPPH